MATDKSYGYIGVDMPRDVALRLAILRRAIPAEDLYTEKGEGGLELRPHATIAYGHEETGTESIREAIKDALAGEGTIGGLSTFDNPDFKVLKFDVDSPQLHELREKLTSRLTFPGMTHKNYEPHVTVAYLRPGADTAKYAALERLLKGRKFPVKMLKSRDVSDKYATIPLQGIMKSAGNKVKIEQLLKDNAKLYHGSSEKLEKLEPRDMHGDPNVGKAVFATPYERMAVAYLGDRWGDRDINQSGYHKDGESVYTMEEMRPGAFDEIYKGRTGYMHELDPKDFERDPRTYGSFYEVISRNEVKPTKIHEIKDVLKHLQEMKGVKLLPYDENSKTRKKAIRRMIKRTLDMDEKSRREYLDWVAETNPELSKQMEEGLEKQASNKERMKSFLLSGSVQGVGVRKTIHKTLDEMGSPGIAVNDARTGKVHVTVPANVREAVMAAVQARLEEKGKEPATVEESRARPMKPMKLDDEVLGRLLNSRYFRRMRENKEKVPGRAEERIRRWALPRYRLHEEDGELVGDLPALARRQLEGKEPVYTSQVGMKKAAKDLMTQEEIFQLVRDKLPRGAKHASGGLPDARGLSDVDIALVRKKHDNLRDKFPEGTTLRTRPDRTIYSIPGYDRPVEVYVGHNKERVRRSVKHRLNFVRLESKYPQLAEKAAKLKASGMGTEEAWATLLGLEGDQYEVMLDTPKVLAAAERLNKTAADPAPFGSPTLGYIGSKKKINPHTLSKLLSPHGTTYKSDKGGNLYVPFNAPPRKKQDEQMIREFYARQAAPLTDMLTYDPDKQKTPKGTKPYELYDLFKRQYGKGFDKELAKANKWARRTKMPFNMGANLQAKPIVYTRPGEGYSYQTGSKILEHRPPVGSLSSLLVDRPLHSTRIPLYKLTGKADTINQLNPQEWIDSERVLRRPQSHESAMLHEGAHAASSLTPWENVNLAEIDWANRNDPVKGARIRSAKNLLFPPDVTYPEYSPDEYVPAISSMQQHLYKTTGKRMESPQDVSALLKKYSGYDPKALEVIMKKEKVPTEARRFLRYQNYIERQKDPKRLKEFQDRVKHWAPGIVRTEQPQMPKTAGDKPHPALKKWMTLAEGYIPKAKRIKNSEGVLEEHKTVGTGHYMHPSNRAKLVKLWGQDRYDAIAKGAPIKEGEDRVATEHHLEKVVPTQLDAWNPNWRKLHPMYRQWLKTHAYSLGDNLQQFKQGHNAVNAMVLNPNLDNSKRLWNAFWNSKFRRQTGTRMNKMKPLYDAGTAASLRGAKKK